MRHIILYPGEDDLWVAECPSLPGCISEAKTRVEAIASIRAAIRGYIDALVHEGLPVPEEQFEAMMVVV
jgi:predicted RNase H-like HicB family nuclease